MTTTTDNGYDAWLKQELRGLIDLLELSEQHKHFLRARWLDQVVWLEGKAKRSQRNYYVLRLVTIIGGVTVPALVSLNVRNKDVVSTLAWVTFGVSLAVALAAAVEGFFRYGDRWRHYRRATEVLKSLGWQFLELTGPYSDWKTHENAYPAFAAQVEALIQQDVDVFITQVARDVKSQEGR